MSSSFQIKFGKLFSLFGICPFTIRTVHTNRLKIETNSLTFIYSLCLFTLFLTINCMSIYLLPFAIFSPKSGQFYTTKCINRYSDFGSCVIFILIQSIISLLSIKNRKKHARLLLRMHYIEVISQPFNLGLNPFSFKHVYLLITGIHGYFIFCVIGLSVELWRLNWVVDFHILFVVYNLQFQTTLLTAGYIRLLLLTAKLRIEAIAIVLWELLSVRDEVNFNRLRPHFKQLYSYFELKYDFDEAFGGQLLMMFLSSIIVISCILFSLASNIRTILIEKTLIVYDVSANVIPSMVMIIGLVQVAEAHGNQVN